MLNKILIVDDSKEQLEIHKRILEGRYDVVCAESGMDAIDIVHEQIPNLILLDIQMPFMDGFETMEKIRAIEGCYNIPIIGLTGKSDKGTVLNFLSKGADNYLVKPVDKNILIDAIEKLLEKEYKKVTQKIILLVDDDITSLRMYQTYLKEKYNVVALNSGKLAVEYLLKHRPDMILLDYQMALFNGVATFKMVRKVNNGSTVPIGFITGCSEAEVLDECSELNPAGIIMKPIDKAALLAKVEEMFNAEEEM